MSSVDSGELASEEGVEEVLLKHREVINELIRNHRESVIAPSVSRTQVIIQRQEDTETLDQGENVESSQGERDYERDLRLLWRRVASVRTLLGYKDDDFIAQRPLGIIWPPDAAMIEESLTQDNGDVFLDCFCEESDMYFEPAMTGEVESDEPDGKIASVTINGTDAEQKSHKSVSPVPERNAIVDQGVTWNPPSGFTERIELIPVSPPAVPMHASPFVDVGSLQSSVGAEHCDDAPSMQNVADSSFSGPIVGPISFVAEPEDIAKGVPSLSSDILSLSSPTQSRIEMLTQRAQDVLSYQDCPDVNQSDDSEASSSSPPPESWGQVVDASINKAVPIPSTLQAHLDGYVLKDHYETIQHDRPDIRESEISEASSTGGFDGIVAHVMDPSQSEVFPMLSLSEPLIRMCEPYEQVKLLLSHPSESGESRHSEPSSPTNTSDYWVQPVSISQNGIASVSLDKDEVSGASEDNIMSRQGPCGLDGAEDSGVLSACGTRTPELLLSTGDPSTSEVVHSSLPSQGDLVPICDSIGAEMAVDDSRSSSVAAPSPSDSFNSDIPLASPQSLSSTDSFELTNNLIAQHSPHASDSRKETDLIPSSAPSLSFSIDDSSVHLLPLHLATTDPLPSHNPSQSDGQNYSEHVTNVGSRPAIVTSTSLTNDVRVTEPEAASPLFQTEDALSNPYPSDGEEQADFEPLVAANLQFSRQMNMMDTLTSEVGASLTLTTFQSSIEAPIILPEKPSPNLVGEREAKFSKAATAEYDISFEAIDDENLLVSTLSRASVTDELLRESSDIESKETSSSDHPHLPSHKLPMEKGAADLILGMDSSPRLPCSRDASRACEFSQNSGKGKAEISCKASPGDLEIIDDFLFETQTDGEKAFPVQMLTWEETIPSPGKPISSVVQLLPIPLQATKPTMSQQDLIPNDFKDEFIGATVGQNLATVSPRESSVELKASQANTGPERSDINQAAVSFKDPPLLPPLVLSSLASISPCTQITDEGARTVTTNEASTFSHKMASTNRDTGETMRGPLSPPRPIRESTSKLETKFDERIDLSVLLGVQPAIVEETNPSPRMFAETTSLLTVESDLTTSLHEESETFPRRRQKNHATVTEISAPESSRVRSNDNPRPPHLVRSPRLGPHLVRSPRSGPHLVRSPRSGRTRNTSPRFNAPLLRTSERALVRKHNDEPTTPHRVQSTLASPGESPARGLATSPILSPTRGGTSGMKSPNRMRSPERGTSSLAGQKTPKKALQGSTLPSPVSPRPRRSYICTNKFVYNLHATMGPCDRCWSIASLEEQHKFGSRGTALSIVRTRGGCGASCKVFPPKEDQAFRLCRNCFFSTHSRDGDRLQVYRGRTKVVANF